MSPIRSFILSLAVIAAPNAVMADEGHGKLPKSVERFHEILSKDWHAPLGPERLRATCSHSGAYVIAASGIVADKVPDGVDMGEWLDVASMLSSGSADLSAQCGTGNDGKILGSLTKLHDRFHKLVDLLKK